MDKERDAIDRVRRGEPEAYAALVREHQAMIRGYCAGTLGNASEADDAAQEVFLKAFRALGRFRGQARFSTWLFRIAVNHCRDVIRRRENVRLVELRYEAGREHQGSYLRIQAALRQAEFEVAQAQRSLRVGRRQMAQVLGREQAEGIEVAGDFGVDAADLAPPDIDTLAQVTPDRLEAQARAAGEGVGVARSRFLPEVNAEGSFGGQSGRFPPDEEDWAAGLSVTLPLFGGGKRIYNLQKAQAEQRRAMDNLRSADRKVRRDLEEAFAAFEDSVERVEVREQFLAAAQLRAQIARAQYTNGLLSFEDWDLIENDLIDNQKAMLATLRDAKLGEAGWERVRGEGVFP